MNRGCFGHIVTYNPGMALCAGCDNAAACAESVSGRVEQLRKLGRYPTLEIKEPGLRSHLSALADGAVSMVKRTAPPSPPAMNKKAKEYAAALAGRGINLRTALYGNHNPITDKPVFIRLAFDMLLQQHTIVKADLKALFMKELGWKEQSAASHVGIVASLFAGLGLAEDCGKELVRYDFG